MRLGVQGYGEPDRRPTSRASESSLFYGYSRATPLPERVEPCACGGCITAPDRDEAIAGAVLAHNNTSTHALWAIANGWRDVRTR